MDAGEQFFFFSLERRSQGGVGWCGLQKDFASEARTKELNQIA
jgi:hypothetical protein